MEAYAASGVDFALETTLSGRAYAVRIRRWQARGYRVAIVYLRPPDVEYAVARVAQRVAEGGHDIPEAVIRRRFARSRANFLELYRDVADEWQAYDNSVRPPRLLQESAGGMGGTFPGGHRGATTWSWPARPLPRMNHTHRSGDHGWQDNPAGSPMANRP